MQRQEINNQLIGLSTCIKKSNMKVKAPKGFHWMKSGKGMPKLMKNPAGGYKPHKGASQFFNFPMQKVHKK